MLGGTNDVGADAHHPSVLVVDDQPTIRMILTRLLTGQGRCTVTDVEDGFAALAHIDHSCVRDPADGARVPTLDLLVLDIMMPKISGLDVLEALRWTYRTIPRTMVISALDDEEHVTEALRLGAVDYLPKPIDSGMFLHRVETLCSLSAGSDFHWAPLARLPAVQLGSYPAQAKAISESGIIVHAGPEERPVMGELVELTSPVFEACEIERKVRARVVRITTLHGKRTMELSFVGLRESDVRGIRRYCVRR